MVLCRSVEMHRISRDADVTPGTSPERLVPVRTSVRMNGGSVESDMEIDA
jgi:hypothetical protein